MRPAQVKTALQTLINIKRPVFIWGPPGVGKSDVVAQVAAEMKLKLIDIRLNLLDPVDLKGFPQPNGKKMSWLPPDFLPSSGKGVLFLDEMNSAPAAVQAAAYQLILNRALGDYKLPDGWSIIAAGNDTNHRSVVHAMPAALANRFVHINFEVHLDDWQQWALANNVSDVTRGYIRYRPGNLVTTDIQANVKAFPSPRTWAFADSIVQGGLPEDVSLELLKGTIGEGSAIEFTAFVREAKNLPSIEKILLNPDKVEVPESVSTRYALVSALEGRTSDNNIDRLLTYVKRLSKEFEVVYMKAVSNNDAVCQTKVFNDWVMENADVLI